MSTFWQSVAALVERIPAGIVAKSSATNSQRISQNGIFSELILTGFDSTCLVFTNERRGIWISEGADEAYIDVKCILVLFSLKRPIMHLV